jgi:hypothetical protein
MSAQPTPQPSGAADIPPAYAQALPDQRKVLMQDGEVLGVFVRPDLAEGTRHELDRVAPRKDGER